MINYRMYNLTPGTYYISLSPSNQSLSKDAAYMVSFMSYSALEGMYE